MLLLEAVVLGVVQGLTEFLPVSSTAHLVLVPWALGWESPLLNSLGFDVALHMGTLAAVLVYFREDWARLARAFASSIPKIFGEEKFGPWERLAWLIIAATIPAAVLGLLFEEYVESTLRHPLIIAFMLSFVAVLMMLAERGARKREGRPVEGMTLPHAVVIGLAQASALIPGVSRSGATITAGLWAGYRRDDAARFSFLLSTPIILGACLHRLGSVADSFKAGEGAVIAAGVAASAVSGFLAIAFLVSYLKKRPLDVFAWYRIAFAAAAAAFFFAK